MALSGTVLALFRHCTRTGPALAWPGLNPVYALVDTGQVRVPQADPGTTCTLGTPLAPPVTGAALHGHSTAAGAGRGAVGLTPGCTGGHIGPARHLPRNPAPCLPADRYPTTRTLCHL